MINKLYTPILCIVTSLSATVSNATEISPTAVIDNALKEICPTILSSSNDLAVTCGIISLSSSSDNGGSAGNLSSTIHLDRVHKKIETRNKTNQKRSASGDILSSERFGFFASGKMTETERQSTTLENGYESDTHGFTVGLDYFFTDQFVAGIAFDYANTDLDYNNSLGNSDYDSTSVIAYSSFNANNGLSLDGYLGWTGIQYDLQRNISVALTAGGTLNTTAKADTEANKFIAGINLAYNLNVNALTLTPSLKLDFSSTYLDEYAESEDNGLALKYDNQDIQSFKSVLGFDSSYAISMPWGVFIPQIHAGYVHEFLDRRRTVHASFVQDITIFDLQFETDKPDRDYFVFGGGISTVLAHSVQLFVDYERTEGHRYLNSFTVSGGVRVGF